MSYTCPRCQWTSHHPMDEKYRCCAHCHKFEDEEPSIGLAHDETYCYKCDVFGHAENSPACEFYYKRWETTDGDDN